MLAISLFGGDQYDNALKVKEMGFGMQLNKMNLTGGELYNTMLKIIQDKR